MNVRQYFQTCRVIMPLLAASTLSACGIDMASYGEPFFKLARDASVADAAGDEPAEAAGSSGAGSRAGSAAPAKPDADGGSGVRDAGESEKDARDD
jgi:hypothetical protein